MSCLIGSRHNLTKPFGRDIKNRYCELKDDFNTFSKIKCALPVYSSLHSLLQTKFLKKFFALGNNDKRVISKLTLLTTPELFFGFWVLVEKTPWSCSQQFGQFRTITKFFLPIQKIYLSKSTPFRIKISNLLHFSLVIFRSAYTHTRK